MFSRSFVLVPILTLSPWAPVESQSRAGDWPQWRGPDRDNVSRETAWISRPPFLSIKSPRMHPRSPLLPLPEGFLALPSVSTAPLFFAP